MDDPRLTPARPDLAAKYLEGKVQAARFVDGETFEVAITVAGLTGEPSSGASLLTQALQGERITIYDRTDEGWAWGQLQSDGYVGWIAERAIVNVSTEPTHKVSALRTFAFPGPSIKIPPSATLPFGARVAVREVKGEFAVTTDKMFVPARHLAASGFVEPDFVAVAERFVGTPYLWGGKTSLGIDCSGLVQIALEASGTRAPRDSDMQEVGLGYALSVAERQHLKRGDLIFWKGHVAIVRDAMTIVHANAHHMATAVENICDAIRRIGASGSDVTSIKRLT